MVLYKLNFSYLKEGSPISLKKYLFLGFIILFNSTCTDNSRLIRYVKPQTDALNLQQNILPIDSFIKIARHFAVNVCVKVDDKEECELRFLHALGSGTIIKRSFKGTYILTAAHLCNLYVMDDLKEETEKEVKELKNGTNKVEYSLNLGLDIMSAYDIDEEAYLVSIVKMDDKNDMCILFTPKLKNRPAVRISTEEPRKGARVYNIAAPQGIFAKQLVPIFEGFYLGNFMEEDDVGDIKSAYSIYAKGGSSGSMVLNHYGELIGMIHSTSMQIDNFSIGPSFKILKSFIKDILDKN